MDTNQIERAICQDPWAEAIFGGVYARDCLPKVVKYPCAMVLNTDPADEPGEHWVAVYFSENGNGEYFDSYGLQPPSCFKHFMEMHSVNWIWNKTQLQDVWTTACGHFCVFYLIYRSKDLPMSDIVSYLNNIEHNDQYVTQFVTELL